MKRLWGSLIVLTGGLCSVLPAAEGDLLQAPTYSPPSGPAAGYGGLGVAPLVQPGPPAYAPGYAPAPYPAAPYYAPPPAGPFAEPAPSRHHGHRPPPQPGCASGSCQSSGCEPTVRNYGTCWINDQYEPEWYVAPMIGFNQPRDMHVDFETTSMRISPDGGWQGAAAAGWASGLNDLGRHRLEVEFAVRSSDIDKFEIGGEPFAMEGDFSVISLMANLWWDFKGANRDWYPSIGAGFGGAHLNFENDFPLAFGSGEIEDNVYAWQLMAGLTWKVKPYLELFVEGKYFHTDTMEVSVEAPGGERNFRLGYHSFGTMFGARILLGKRVCDAPATSGSSSWTWHPYSK